MLIMSTIVLVSGLEVLLVAPLRGMVISLTNHGVSIGELWIL